MECRWQPYIPLTPCTCVQMNLFIAVLKTRFGKYGNSPLHRRTGGKRKRKSRRGSIDMVFGFLKGAFSKLGGDGKQGGIDQHMSMARRKSSVKFGGDDGGGGRGDDFLADMDEAAAQRRQQEGPQSQGGERRMGATSFAAASSMGGSALSGQSGYFGADGPYLDANVTEEVDLGSRSRCLTAG